MHSIALGIDSSIGEGEVIAASELREYLVRDGFKDILTVGHILFDENLGLVVAYALIGNHARERLILA